MPPAHTQFLQGMKELCFEAWDLEDIKLAPIHPLPYFHWKETLTDVFPRIKTVYGAPKEEYLAWYYRSCNI